jgi:hypothetical protein
MRSTISLLLLFILTTLIWMTTGVHGQPTEEANKTLSPYFFVKSDAPSLSVDQLAGGKLQSGLLLLEGDKESFFLLMLQTPKWVNVRQIPPREYIFIVDLSGSMQGFPRRPSTLN